eukprot:COSAG06_NODE_58958_length_275_cov_1.176136_1_plen_32_part_10
MNTEGAAALLGRASVNLKQRSPARRQNTREPH